MASLTIRNIYKSYGAVRVLHGVDLDIADNEFVVFVGPSGCGKSTLLRIIAGLEDIDDGTIMIGDRDVTDQEPVDRGIAMVFQSYALYPHMTVAENMSFGLKVTKTPPALIAERVASAVKSLQLDDYLDRKPSQLSGGQRQRVAIGRAIVRQPEVFLFDEPLSNLDAELRVHMRIEIARLHKKLGATMVYVTHDQVEAMTLADRIVVLQDGRVKQVGTPLELFDDPDNLFVAGFIGSPRMNFLPATVVRSGGNETDVVLENSDGPQLTLLVGRDDVREGQVLSLGIRPSQLSIGSGRATIAARTDVFEQMGDTGYLHADTTGGNRLTVEVREREYPDADSEVMLGFDPARAFLFGQDGERIR